MMLLVNVNSSSVSVHSIFHTGISVVVTESSVIVVTGE